MFECDTEFVSSYNKIKELCNKMKINYKLSYSLKMSLKNDELFHTFISENASDISYIYIDMVDYTCDYNKFKTVHNLYRDKLNTFVDILCFFNEFDLIKCIVDDGYKMKDSQMKMLLNDCDCYEEHYLLEFCLSHNFRISNDITNKLLNKNNPVIQSILKHYKIIN